VRSEELKLEKKWMGFYLSGPYPLKQLLGADALAHPDRLASLRQQATSPP